MSTFSGATIYAPSETTSLSIGTDTVRGIYGGDASHIPDTDVSGATASWTAAMGVSDTEFSSTRIYHGGVLGLRNVSFSGNSYTDRSGGAVKGTSSTTITIAGGTFLDNRISGKPDDIGGNYARGGAVYDAVVRVAALDGVGTVFIGNTAQGHGGAIYSNNAVLISGATFHKNRSTNSYGGAIYSQGNSATVTDTLFLDNTAASGNYGGGAAYFSITNAVTISGCTFSGNQAGVGGALYFDKGTVTISGCTFTTITDSIYSRATLTFAGENILSASLVGNGATVAADGRLTFINTAAITVAALTFAGNNSVVLAGNRAVNFSGQSLENATLTVDGALESGTFTLATGLTSDLGDTISVNGYAVAFDDAHVSAADSDFIQKITYSGGTLALQSADTITIGYGTGDGFSSFATYEDFLAAGYDGFTGTIDEYGTVSATIYAPDGATRVVAGGTVYVGANAGTAAPASIDAISVISGLTWDSRIEVSARAVFSDGAFSGSTAATSGGAMYSANAAVTILNSEISDNFADNFHTDGKNYARGGAFYVEGSTFTAQNTVFTGNTSKGLGGVLCSSNSHDLISDSVFTNNRSLTQNGGAIYSSGFVAVVTDSLFVGNRVSSHGGAIYTQTNTTTITGSTFSGNSIVNGNGGALYIQRGTATIRDSVFATASDSVYTLGALTLDGVNRFNASLGGGNTITVASGAELIFGNREAVSVAELTFAGNNSITLGGSAAVNFAGQDFTGATITLDNSGYTGGNFVVATGIGTVGAVDFGGYADRFSYTVADGTLSYSAEADVQAGDRMTTFTGGTYNLMTGGEITGAFFGTNNTSGDVATVISGGTVGNAVIGGARVQNTTASLDAVTLNIAGGEIKGGSANGGMLYTAGYAYGLTGGTTTDASATLTVAKSELNLTGGSIAAQNLYSGAHARAGAYTVVDETVITVTDGTYKRIYGGGWAEKYGRSEVGSSTISVSGGRVEYIYAGGGNALNGTTVTGGATIGVSGDASVDFVFLAGKNANCFVSHDVSLTLSGDAKSLIRISGRNGNGSDNTGGATSLTVATNTTVGYLDNVDLLNLTQGSTLDITTFVQYESIADATLNFLTDGSNEEWTALSGAGFELFQNAQFQVNGAAVVRDAATGALGESGYKLDFTDDKFIISKLA